MQQQMRTTEVTQDWPPEAQKAAQMIEKVIMSDKGANAVKFVQSAGDIIRGAGQFIFQQITQAEKRVGDIPDELLYADGGLSDLMLAMLWKLLEDAGVEGADNQEAYEATLDLIDELAGFGGEAPEGEEPLPPEGEPPPEQAALPPMGQQPIMGA